MPQSALAMETLRVLAWPGYADADLVTIFEQRHGVHVEVTLVDNDDVLREKMAADQGAHFDVIAANTAEMVHYIDSGLIQPIDTQNIPNLRKQLPRFRPLSTIPGITRAGRVYAIPYTYSEMGLIYDRRRFKTAPSRYADLWDPGTPARYCCSTAVRIISRWRHWHSDSIHSIFRPVPGSRY
ncbi:extracellular solute-binding protein [Thiobacillus sp.]|uniref:extracellular solute-binding protein n=1 Tax=Thiobacillus sp. TaxID=924 RepID=UPI0025F0F5CE|nr:extracellular solute-binding protein [Thiobacillus sp.]